jgi:hypothetical protein
MSFSDYSCFEVLRALEIEKIVIFAEMRVD